jgi:hypothetical protein
MAGTLFSKNLTPEWRRQIVDGEIEPRDALSDPAREAISKRLSESDDPTTAAEEFWAGFNDRVRLMVIDDDDEFSKLFERYRQP